MRFRISPPRSPERSAIGRVRAGLGTLTGGGAATSDGQAGVSVGAAGGRAAGGSTEPAGGAAGTAAVGAPCTGTGFFAASAYFAGPNSTVPSFPAPIFGSVARSRTAVGGSQEVSVQVWNPTTISASPGSVLERRTSNVTGPSTPLAAANSATWDAVAARTTTVAARSATDTTVGFPWPTSLSADAAGA